MPSKARYYSLGELVTDEFPTTPSAPNMDGLDLADAAGFYLPETFSTAFAAFYTDEMKALLTPLVARCWNSYVAIGPTSIEIMDERNAYSPFKKQVERMLSWMMRRCPYYLTLLKYRDGITDYMAQVGSTAKRGSRYNDTPDSDGTLANYYDDDVHASSTHAEQSETSSDYDTPMGRLREITDNYPDVTERMTNEFIEKFVLVDFYEGSDEELVFYWPDSDTI